MHTPSCLKGLKPRACPRWRALALIAGAGVSLPAGATPLESWTPTAGVTLRGHFIQGGLIAGQCDKPCKIAVEGKRVQVADDNTFAFGFGRDAAQIEAMSVTFGAGAPIHASLRVQKRNYDIEHIKGVPGETVTPPPEVSERIAREQAMIESARNAFTQDVAYRGNFVWPVKGRVSGVFGSQRFYNDVPKAPHNGLDIAAATGTDVRAPADGVVKLANNDLYFSGGTLIVDHGHGIYSSFIHLSEVIAHEGDHIHQGDVIGKVGQTGRANGPHLHWSINWFDERLDPQLLLPPQ